MSLDLVHDIIIQVAQEKVLPRFNNLQAGEVTAKSPGDMVSIADIEAEIALTAALTRLFPEAVVGGEESIAERPALLAAVSAADRAFLIDPVDGTNNFIRGDDKFALMVVELRAGVAVAAWIYLPVPGRMAMAESGGGAFLDGRKIT
ncbi:MAG: inositol monophosphatase, partial [Alphaproteobacteria bacterium]|nr:inositol monophosphatase [Alphaproteobacteria bacterium]